MKIIIPLVILLPILILPRFALAGVILKAPPYIGLQEGLVGYWSFNGPDMSGNTATDRSGNANNGTLTNGPTRAIGKLGQALEFDGVDDAVTVLDPNIIEGLTQMSVSLWVKSSTATSPGNLVIMRQGGVGNDPFSLEWQGNGNIIFVVRDNSNVAVTATFVLGITDTNWHFLVGTYDGANVRIYIDTIVGGTVAAMTAAIGTTAADMSVAEVSNDWRGLIDEVRVYNRALTEQEIKRLYKMGSTLKVNVTRKNTLTSGLVGHWTFDGPEMSGNTATDRSGNANNGTLTNGPKRAIGKLGQALEFDGVDGYVTIPFTNITGYPFTLSAWTKASAGSNGSPARSVVLGISETQYFGIGWTSTNGTPLLVGRNTTFDSITAPAVGLNIWTHLVGVFRNATDRELFVNGISSVKDTSSVTELTTTDTVQIGDIFGTSALNLFGAVDEVRIYNRALSADEIKRLYNMGR